MSPELTSSNACAFAGSGGIPQQGPGGIGRSARVGSAASFVPRLDPSVAVEGLIGAHSLGVLLPGPFSAPLCPGKVTFFLLVLFVERKRRLCLCSGAVVSM